MQVSMKVDGLDKALHSLNPTVVNRATRLAINEAAKAGRTAAGKVIRSSWNLKAGRVNAELRNVKMATGADLTANIQAKGRPISLSHYGFRPVQRTTKGKGGKYRRTLGATGSIFKGTKVTYRKAFMAGLANGHRGVFMNKADFFGGDYQYHTPTKGAHAGQRGRTGIVSLASITIASIFHQAKVWAPTVAATTKRWTERFAYHLDRLQK
jgi:hypothetical protein